MAMRLCAAAAKLRGDAWLGVFDVDEFMWAPPPTAAGGFAAAAPLGINSAPLRSGSGGLRPALDYYGANLLWTSITMEGQVRGARVWRAGQAGERVSCECRGSHLERASRALA